MISNNKSNKTFGVSVWAIQNSTIIYVLMAVFLILGVRAYVTMPRENFPEITETTIFISTPYPGNTAQDIERFVTDPIEEGIKGVSNIVEISSTSQDDYSIVSVEFDEDIDVDLAKQKIKVALSATIIATIILLFFALLGSSLLSYLHISYPAFTIGGGIILLIIF